MKRTAIWLVVLGLALTACGSGAPAIEHAVKPLAIDATEKIDCIYEERKRGEWMYAGGFALPPDAGAGTSARKYTIRAEHLAAGQDVPLLLMKIKDKSGDPDRLLTHHTYRLQPGEPTNPFTPHGFTGKVEAYLENGPGLRYWCRRS